MGERRARPPLTAEQIEDAKRLKAMWQAYRRTAVDVTTQEKLADATGLGTQGLVSQYINGTIALNLRAVLAFARVMKCDPADISPSLAGALPPRVVAERPAVYSASARAVADFIDSQPPEQRPKIALIVHTLFARAVSDGDVLKASEEWESPEARKRKAPKVTKRGKE